MLKDHKHWSNLHEQTIQIQLSQELKVFSQYFTAFLMFPFNFEHFKKKLSLVADVFLKL